MSAGGRGSSIDVRGQATPGPRTERVKFQLPPARDGTLRRDRLTERVVAAARPLVCIVAPAGYGKTTILGQLAERSPRTAYVRLDETDNDPTILLTDLFDALDMVQPLDPEVRRAMGSPALMTGFRAPAQFAQQLGRVERPALLCLDDVHLVQDRTARDWLGWIVDRLPARLQVALVARRDPGIPVARQLAAGTLLELGPLDLALTPPETQELARLAGVDLSPDEARALTSRTEGWPLAAHLLLRSGRDAVLRDGPIHAHDLEQPVRPSGISRYLRAELFERLDQETREWLLRASVLEVLSGPACDAALDTQGSLRRLRELEASNQLLLPLDEQRTTYRFHALYREFLATELEAHLPGELTRVATRASQWAMDQRDIHLAVRLAHRSGDLDLLALQVERAIPAVFWRGGMAAVREWLTWFDQDGVRDRYPVIAAATAWREALVGETALAAHWLTLAERAVDQGLPADRPVAGKAWLLATRGVMMPAGLEVHRRDLAELMSLEVAPGPLTAQIWMARALGMYLEGRFEEADRVASDGIEAAQAMGAAPALMILLSLRAVLAMTRGDLVMARTLVDRAEATSIATQTTAYVSSALSLAVAARVAVAEGRVETGRAQLAMVNRMRPFLTAAIGWLAVAVRLQAIRAAIQLREPATARTLMAEVQDILRSRPDLGTLTQEAAMLRPMVEGLRTAEPGPWTLTAAELRLLVYLPTRLTFREIAERMHLSPHTIKTQAMSIYGKLEVTSRREAIERAVEVSLLDASVLHQAGGPALVA